MAVGSIFGAKARCRRQTLFSGLRNCRLRQIGRKCRQPRFSADSSASFGFQQGWRERFRQWDRWNGATNAITSRLLSVNISAPATTTRIRPAEKTRPASTRATPKERALSLNTRVEKRAPRPMNPPPNTPSAVNTRRLGCLRPLTRRQPAESLPEWSLPIWQISSMKGLCWRQDVRAAWLINPSAFHLSFSTAGGYPPVRRTSAPPPAAAERDPAWMS
jgi:hypothetical protein